MVGPIMNKKMVRQSKELRKIGKRAKKRFQGAKGRYPKGRIQKVVELREYDSFLDFVGGKGKALGRNANYENLIELTNALNLFGMSGSGDCVATKLAAIQEVSTKEKYLIINAVECEPGLLTDEWLLNHQWESICQGIKVLTDWLSFHRVILASKLNLDGKKQSDSFEVVQVPNQYPMGEEHILIHQVLGLEILAKTYPTEQGILVMNVQTILSIGQAMLGQYIEKSKYITVANLKTGQAAIARVKIGMSIEGIANKAFPNVSQEILYTGGGIMYATIATNDMRVDEHTGFIAFGEKTPFLEDSKCKRCGACSKKCPMGVEVYQVVRAYEKNQKVDLLACHMEQCIECGNCTYVCPANRNNMNFLQRRKAELYAKA